jgi:hypothetical protein
MLGQQAADLVMIMDHWGGKIMGIDASIYHQFAPQVKSVAEYDNERMKGEQNSLALALQQQKSDEYTRSIDDANKLRGVVSGFTNDRTANQQSLTRAGRLKEAEEYGKGSREAAKADLENRKAELEGHMKKFELAGQIMTGVRDQATWDQARAQTAQVFGQEAAAQMPTVYDPQAVEAKRLQAMPVKEQLVAQHQKVAEALAQSQFDYKQKNDAADRGVLIRGQNQTAATAGARLAFDQQAPRGVVIQTDSGPMLADPRGGTARPVTGPDGQPLTAKMKSLPAPIQKALLENDAALRKVDAALSSIDAYPDAFGMSNILGDTIRQRTDPKGVKGRALVADIGSLKLHDRSGAAVTAAEAPRLKPFIPAATDDVATIKEKLSLFKQEYQAIQNDINSTYTTEQGYRAPPARVDKPAAAPQAPAKVTNAADYAKVPSGAEYVTPDGHTRRKP